MHGTVIGKRQAGLMARLGSALNAALPPPPRKNDPVPGAGGSPLSRRHHDALAVLTAARGVIRRGWVQNTWYTLETPAGRRRTMPSIFPSRVDRSRVVEACLVGAVTQAAWEQSPRPERAYPAIDALWHALLGGAAGGAEPVGPLCPPPERVSRVRDLTTWNDRRHRTRDEVLDLIDRTVEAVRTGPLGAPPRG